VRSACGHVTQPPRMSKPPRILGRAGPLIRAPNGTAVRHPHSRSPVAPIELWARVEPIHPSWVTTVAVRLAGFLVAVALLGGGAALGQKLRADAAHENLQRATDKAGRSAGDAVTGLERQLALFQLKASNAASNQLIQQLVRAGANDATFHDGLTNEQWSAAY